MVQSVLSIRLVRSRLSARWDLLDPPILPVQWARSRLLARWDPLVQALRLVRWLLLVRSDL